MVTSEALPGKIIYANADAPSFPLKPYNGQHYQDRIPDTYDIQSRAALGVNALTGATNPLANYELYWQVKFANNPVLMNHDWNDWCQIKFQESLPLLRMVSGSQQEIQVDQAWQDVTLKSLGPDGLHYIPMQGRPWAWDVSFWTDRIARADGTLAQLRDATVTQITNPFVNGRMMGTMLIYWLRDHNPIWLEAIRKMVDRLAELATYRDDFAYYPAFVYEPNAIYDQNSPQSYMPIHILGGEISGRLPEGLGKVYRFTGYEPARILGEKIVRYVKYHMDHYGPNGEFLAEKHFHGHTIYLLSILEFALATGDQNTVEFVKRGYEWAKTPASGACDLVGYFPEVADPAWPAGESCEIGDMITLALRLTVAGAGDYYNDAERWTRNHFAEAQLTDATWVNEQAQHRPMHPPAYNETGDRVAERNVGGFAQGSSGNEFWTKNPDGIVHCCTGNCTRTIYYLWRDAVRGEEGRLSVNLLLNQASPWADVYSYIPYRGQVDVHLKQDMGEVRMHAPAWIAPGSPDIAVTLDGQPCPFGWEGRFMILGRVAAGRTLKITFPIEERQEHAVMSLRHYELTIKGDTVVDIFPPGQVGPLYRRDHYRQSEPRWRDVTRFVSDERIDY
jgi:hypothetical protein